MIEVLFIVYLRMCADPSWSGRSIYDTEDKARMVAQYGAKTYGCHYQIYKTSVTAEDFVEGCK